MTKPLSDFAMRGKVGAYRKWAQTSDRADATAPARSAFMRRFEDEVDPQRELSEFERQQRAHFAMRAFMADITRRRVLSRRRRSESDDSNPSPQFRARRGPASAGPSPTARRLKRGDPERS
jgi:hypothetical protein